MADKKLFELLLGTPATSDKIAFGKAGTTYKNITYGDLKNMIIAGIPTPYVPEFLTKVVNITNFDMSGTGEKTKDVDLGVDRSKIRSCVVLIRSNDGGLYPLSMPSGNNETKSYWFIRQESTYASNARVHIYSDARVGGSSFFDQGAFDGNGTGGIRGYIYVTYLP